MNVDTDATLMIPAHVVPAGWQLWGFHARNMCTAVMPPPLLRLSATGMMLARGRFSSTAGVYRCYPASPLGRGLCSLT